MVKLHFLHNQWSDVNHIWQLRSCDDYVSSLWVLWTVPILFGCQLKLRVCSNGHTRLTVMPTYENNNNKKPILLQNCSNDDHFISCNDRIGKMLHNICMSAVAISLRWASRDLWATCFYFSVKTCCGYSDIRSTLPARTVDKHEVLLMSMYSTFL